MYNLPKFNLNNFERKYLKIFKNKLLQAAVLALIIITAVGFIAGKISIDYFGSLNGKIDSFLKEAKNNLEISGQEKASETYVSRIEYEQAIIDTVKKASPSVVSIIISKNVPVYEQELVNPFGDLPDFDIRIPQYVQKGTKKQEVGAGSGFIVSEDGLVLTNKHVVADKEAEYAVLTNDGKKYSAGVLALDPVQDLAVIKIEGGEKFPVVVLGNSDKIQIGQGAVAIGNALGEFRNTISMGVISGLGRTVPALSGGFSETLEDVIQTDAAINPGNSGGPLLNLKGEVIGVNVAMAQGAQSIGFAIPINIAKRDINQITKGNKLSYPFLGIRYVLVDEQTKQKYGLSVDYGALIIKGENGEPSVVKDSAAQKAGLKENDLILEFNGEKLGKGNSMAKMIAKYNPGDAITLKVLRDGKEMNVSIVLGERD